MERFLPLLLSMEEQQNLNWPTELEVQYATQLTMAADLLSNNC